MLNHLGRFQSTHPVWGGTLGRKSAFHGTLFQSTHPVWGGTSGGWWSGISRDISIHPPRVGWDNGDLCRSEYIRRFQSTHPVWGGTTENSYGGSVIRISIHPPRVGWDPVQHVSPQQRGISIHPPRVGWDLSDTVSVARLGDFNPPTPCGVGLGNYTALFYKELFQSTHPVWGGTRNCKVLGAVVPISIHPPRVGWDHRPFSRRRRNTDFNPPTPCGVGRACTATGRACRNFNPPTPCGVGRRCSTSRRSSAGFQSTHPVWGGTLVRAVKVQQHLISIHPPRVGWDCLLGHADNPIKNFNPPTPCGVGRNFGAV